MKRRVRREGCGGGGGSNERWGTMKADAGKGFIVGEERRIMGKKIRKIYTDRHGAYSGWDELGSSEPARNKMRRGATHTLSHSDPGRSRDRVDFRDFVSLPNIFHPPTGLSCPAPRHGPLHAAAPENQYGCSLTDTYRHRLLAYSLSTTPDQLASHNISQLTAFTEWCPSSYAPSSLPISHMTGLVRFPFPAIHLHFPPPSDSFHLENAPTSHPGKLFPFQPTTFSPPV
jgi:hypothetical protein